MIDGRLDEPAWAACPKLSFVRFPNGEKPTHPTLSRLGTDGSWLFVGMECEDPALLEDDARPYRVDTPVTAGDAVEVFVDPGTDGEVYYHFAADRFGQQHEKKCSFNRWTRKYDKDSEYNTHWRAAGSKTDRGWSVEMAIPLTVLKREEGSASEWRINVCRHEQDLESNTREWSQWAPTQHSFHEPGRFGIVSNIPKRVSSPPFLPVLEAVRSGPVSDARGLNEYTVRVGLRNESPKGGNVQLVIDDNAPGGGRRRFEETVGLGGNEVRIFSRNIETPGMVGVIEPDPVAQAHVSDALGAWTVSMANMMGRFSAEADRPLDAYLGRSYYTSESTASLHYAVALPEAQLSTLQLAVACRQSSSGTEEQDMFLERRLPGLTPGEHVCALPLAALPLGNTRVEVRLLSAGGALLDKAALTLVKRPPLESGTEVKVDRHNRCLLKDGRPFFPFGVCRLKGEVEELADIGFNMFIRWGGGLYFYDLERGKSAREVVVEDPLLQAAAAHGMYVVDRPIITYMGIGQFHAMRRAIRTRGRGEPLENIALWFNTWEQLVPHLKHQPALLGYQIFDEPHDFYIGDIPQYKLSQDVAEAFRELDGYHPLFNNANLPTRSRWRDHVDLASTYQYWVVGRPGMAEAISGRAKRANRLCEEWHMPWFSMPGVGELTALPLRHRERRISLYLRLVNGARGIYFFTWPAHAAASVQSFRALSREVHRLAPGLVRRRPDQHVTYPDVMPGYEAVDASLLSGPAGSCMFLTVNKRDHAVDVTYTFEWLPEGCVFRELFMEGVRHETPSHTFSETLESYAVRAYAIEGYTLPDPLPEPLSVVIRESASTRKIPSVIVALDCETDDQWTIRDWHTNCVVFDADASHGGDRSIRLHMDLDKGSNHVVRAHSKPFELKSGHQYRLEGWTRVNYTNILESQPHRGAFMQVRLPAGPTFPYICIGPGETCREWKQIRRQRGFVIPEDTTAQIRLQIWRVGGTVWFDDIRIVDLGYRKPPEGRSKNLVPNGSFEHARIDGWPSRWMVHQICDFSEGLVGTDTSPWGQDTQESWHGRYALKMTGGKAWHTMSWYQRNNAGIPLRDESQYVLSFYAKANRDSVPIKIRWRDVEPEPECTFELRTDWQRYTMTGRFHERAWNNSTTDIKMTLPDRGHEGDVIHIDAVQLEQGTEPTAFVEDAYRDPP